MTGYVYFIQRGTGGPIKIGHSGNPAGRMSTLQVGCADRLVLLGSIAGSVETERALHAAYAPEHISGEWFQPTERLVALATSYQDGPKAESLRKAFDSDGLRERLKARREQLGMSQRAVCYAAGLSNAYISILERGAKQVVDDPGVATISAIATVLDCCQAWLAFGVGRSPLSLEAA